MLAVLMALAALPRLGLAQEAELASRLSQDATALVEQLVGEGRGRVLVRVEGERSESVSERSLDTPVMKRPAAPADSGMPGYEPSAALSSALKHLEREQKTDSRSAFHVRRVVASVLLDSSIPAGQANAITQVLTEMLRLEQQRGDSIAVVRAKLRPGWPRVVFSSPVLAAAVAGLLVLLGVLLTLGLGYKGYAGLRPLADAALERLESLREPPPPPPIRPPTLSELGVARGVTLDAAESFAFLDTFSAEKVQAALADETAEDLALLFSHLSDHRPEKGARLFAGLAASVQVEVSRNLVRLSRPEPQELAQLESRLLGRLEAAGRGPERLGRLVSGLAPQERTSLLGGLSATDAEASAQLREALGPKGESR
ncbi:MAG: hypothetical protein HY554_01595 [Elusimicrobia bacterium]|nr:hypothetical protein [Elusimicrobiota bacterium]